MAGRVTYKGAAEAHQPPAFLLDKDFGFDILLNNAIGSNFQKFLFLFYLYQPGEELGSLS